MNSVQWHAEIVCQAVLNTRDPLSRSPTSEPVIVQLNRVAVRLQGMMQLYRRLKDACYDLIGTLKSRIWITNLQYTRISGVWLVFKNVRLSVRQCGLFLDHDWARFGLHA